MFQSIQELDLQPSQYPIETKKKICSREKQESLLKLEHILYWAACVNKVSVGNSSNFSRKISWTFKD